MPVHLVLVHPEIPANTGNIIRLSANTGAHLHLVEPLGFNFDDKHLRRAGLDYHDLAVVGKYASLNDALCACGNGRRFAVTEDGNTRYDSVAYISGDVLMFGCESKGLPQAVRDAVPRPQHLFIPMRANNRSLNLSNAAAILTLEAWRQLAFAGAVRTA